MQYSKPEVTQIGDARQLIADPVVKNNIGMELGGQHGTPAYDLDE